MLSSNRTSSALMNLEQRLVYLTCAPIFLPFTTISRRRAHAHIHRVQRRLYQQGQVERYITTLARDPVVDKKLNLEVKWSSVHKRTNKTKHVGTPNVNNQSGSYEGGSLEESASRTAQHKTNVDDSDGDDRKQRNSSSTHLKDQKGPEEQSTSSASRCFSASIPRAQT